MNSMEYWDCFLQADSGSWAGHHDTAKKHWATRVIPRVEAEKDTVQEAQNYPCPLCRSRRAGIETLYYDRMSQASMCFKEMLSLLQIQCLKDQYLNSISYIGAFDLWRLVSS